MEGSCTKLIGAIADLGGHLAKLRLITVNQDGHLVKLSDVIAILGTLNGSPRAKSTAVIANLGEFLAKLIGA